jgi:voltage-gated potassium channel
MHASLDTRSRVLAALIRTTAQARMADTGDLAIAELSQVASDDQPGG